jgi:hypothetical protein
MVMDHDKISASIEALRAEISRLHADDAASRTRLDALIADLEKQLDDPETSDRSGLEASVGELIEQFEVKHPRITGVLNDLMVTLSGMGI